MVATAKEKKSKALAKFHLHSFLGQQPKMRRFLLLQWRISISISLKNQIPASNPISKPQILASRFIEQIHHVFNRASFPFYAEGMLPTAEMMTALTDVS